MTKKLLLSISLIVVAGCSHTTKQPIKENPPITNQTRKKQAEKKYTDKNRAIFYYINFSLAWKRGEVEKAEKFINQAINLDPENPELLLKGSMFFASVNKLKKAIELAEKAARLKTDQKREKTLRLLGTLYIMNGEKEKAREIYKKLTPISSNPKDFIIYGKLLLQEGKFKEAEKILKRGIQIDNANSDLHFLLGYTLLKERKFKKSEKELIKAAKLNPEDENVYKFLLKIYKKNNSKAIKKFMENGAKKENPPLVLLKELVKIYIISGEKDKAVETLNKIVEREPYNLKNLTEVATGLLELKEYKKVIPVIKKITILNPDNPNAYLMLGISYELTGKTEEAIKAYGKALDLFPENTTVIERLANLYIDNGNLEEAKAYYERLYQLTKKPEYLLKIAKIEDSNGNTEKAYKLLKKLAEKNSKNAKILFSLAVISDKLGFDSETIKYLRKVLEIDPENSAALNYLSYIFANRGENLEEALQLIKKALKLQPKNPAYIDTYGWVLFKLGKYDKACDTLEKAYNLSNKDPVVEEHLGECYYYTGKWEEAKKLLREAIRKMKENPKSIEGEKEILKRAEEILRKLNRL